MCVAATIAGLLPMAQWDSRATLDFERSDCSARGNWELGAVGSDSAWDLSAIETSSRGCGAQPPRGTTAPPPKPITATVPCTPASDPARTSDDMRGVCEAVAATQIAACDPALGYTGDLITYPSIDIPGYRPAPYPSALITCNTTPQAPPIVVTEADFRALLLTPSSIVVGPPQGWVPVNMIAVVYTDASPQTLTTTLLGQPVTVRATPTRYTWAWADGSPPTATTDPGAPWPDHSLTHTYTTTGTYTVTMVTTWTGEYSLDAGASYSPIAGTATTTSTAPPLTVRELRTHLVEDLIG